MQIGPLCKGPSIALNQLSPWDLVAIISWHAGALPQNPPLHGRPYFACMVPQLHKPAFSDFCTAFAKSLMVSCEGGHVQIAFLALTSRAPRTCKFSEEKLEANSNAGPPQMCLCVTWLATASCNTITPVLLYTHYMTHYNFVICLA